jgi:hypothetical protein
VRHWRKDSESRHSRMMLETKAYRGTWWIPGDEKRLSGVLTVTRGDPVLVVDGGFDPSNRERLEVAKREGAREGKGEVEVGFGTPTAQERICGSADGTLMTLVGCSVTRSKGGLLEYDQVTYRARAAILGQAFEGEGIEFDEIEVRTTELEKWIGHAPFPYETKTTDGPVDGLTELALVHLIRPENIEIPLNDGAIVTLKFALHTSGLGDLTTEATLVYHPWIGVRFSQPRDLEGATRAVWQVRNFLSLAIGKPLAILAVDGYPAPSEHADGDEDPEPRERVEILYPVARNPDPPERGVFPWEILFTFGQTRGRLAEVLSAWFGQHELLEPVFALYFGTLYNPELYLEQRFLAFAQAIETYDRRRRPKVKERDRKQHKALVMEIVAAAPKQERDWLKGKLAWSNDLALAQRLRHILSLCKNVTARIVGGDDEDDEEAFVKLVRDTRNYYTHYDPAGKAKAATDPRDLYRLTVQLRAILETIFLRELDFDCTAIEEILTRSRRFEEIDIQR